MKHCLVLFWFLCYSSQQCEKKRFKCHCAVIIYNNASAPVEQIGMIGWFRRKGGRGGSLQALIRHLITKASVHFFTLISTPCHCQLHRIYYTALISMEFRGLTGVTGQTWLIVWLFTPSNHSALYEGAGPYPNWDRWNSTNTKTNGFYTASSNHYKSNEPDFSFSFLL